MTHDYKRNGTATLFAALNVADGTVISMCDDRHRHQEWLQFLRVIDQVTPAGKALHLIADNYATHKHAKVQRWLKRHPRFHVRFTPTSSSWLNMVERFFRDLTQNRLRPRRLPRCRGVNRGDWRLHRPPQRESQTIHLDCQGKRHLGKSEARPRSLNIIQSV
jgi:transposase